MNQPILILISGKRFSGKDFLVNLMKEIFQKKKIACKVESHSLMMKQIYCEKTGKDLDRMEKDRSYKEENRLEMTQMYKQLDLIEFPKKLHQNIQSLDKSYQIILIRDFRRLYEYYFYIQNYKYVFTVRINALDEVKQQRGWKLEQEKDQDITETELDYFDKWSYVFNNNHSKEVAQNWIQDLLFPHLQILLPQNQQINRMQNQNLQQIPK